MRIFASCAVMILAAFAFTACNSTDRSSANAPTANPSVPSTVKQPPTVTADGVRRITVAQLQELIAKGEAFIVDVRNQPAFDQAHIRGAKLIPTTEVAARAGELPRDKTIVTYCSWPSEHTSAGAVVTMKAKGIENAAALLGGFDAWKQAGLPVEAKQ